MDEKERIYGERYPLDEDFLAALAIMPKPAAWRSASTGWSCWRQARDRIDDVIWTPLAR